MSIAWCVQDLVTQPTRNMDELPDDIKRIVTGSERGSSATKTTLINSLVDRLPNGRYEFNLQNPTVAR
eukprot:4893883-Alexandrium_andersonii.AAC.1